MKKIMAAIAALALSGCADLTAALAPPYVPKPIHVYKPVQFAADDAECAKAGATYVPKFSIGSVATATVDGATSNSSMIPLSPWVPVAGAAGGALRSSADGLDVMSGQHANVYRNCLHDETLIDGSAVLVNPN